MNTIRIASAALVIVFALSAVPAHPSQDAGAASREALLRGDWGKVGASAQRWKQRSPTAFAADWLFAYASLAGGHYNEATQGFSHLDNAAKVREIFDYASSLASQNAKSGTAQMLLGDALARKGDYAASRKALNRAVQLSPDSALLYDVRGVVHALAGDTEAALADFDKAIDLAPGFADAYASRALARGHVGNIEGALSDFARALELAPDHIVARNGRAVILASLGRVEEATSDLRIAAQGGVGFAAIAANLSAIEWLSSRQRFTAEIAGERSGVLRMEALSVYSGVNTENDWQQIANLGVDVLRQKSGKDALVVPFRASDGLSYSQIRDTAHDVFLNAVRADKNIVPVIVPHLTLAGYMSPIGGADQRQDLEFGKVATLAIHAGFQQAQKELIGAGQQLSFEHAALSHSWGTVVETEAIENAHQQLGLRPFTGPLWYVAPRVGQDRIAGLNKLGV